ncbi:MAG: glutamine-hydrolyzing carbamoyl-phosphate synthase small subunit [Nanoarchaeota archaeon]|nr:glutamine-hydrolyzing carbamoyl-phosphate synthase small subunit [Nanoarchaeota archaeon]
MDARLVLEDGTVFPGISFGYETSVSGEVVFNTGMVGYPETLTDPSYRGQILALTYPIIGSYGVPRLESDGFGLPKNFESGRIQITGLIISQLAKESHYTSEMPLAKWLKNNRIPAISGIDTRALTIKLREKGVMLGKIVIGSDVELTDPNTRNLVAEVSCDKVQKYGNGKKVVLVDCGAKANIIRLLAKQCQVIRVPWDYDFTKEEYDGVVVSNGPGDPKACTKTIDNIKKAMSLQKPIFGICLGNQILALASGADTYKLKFGHRSQNQPCIEKGTKRCLITSQNHGYAVDEKTLKQGWMPWFSNANDGTNEGIIHKNGKWKSVQFHPESSPGPEDTSYLLDDFVRSL